MPNSTPLSRSTKATPSLLFSLANTSSDSSTPTSPAPPPAVEGVTDAILPLNDRQWREAVGTLRTLRVLSPPPEPDDGSIDAPPLVREWFGLQGQQESPA